MAWHGWHGMAKTKITNKTLKQKSQTKILNKTQTKILNKTQTKLKQKQNSNKNPKQKQNSNKNPKQNSNKTQTKIPNKNSNKTLPRFHRHQNKSSYIDATQLKVVGTSIYIRTK